VLACTLLKLLEECSVDLPINRRSDIQRRKFSELIAIWKRVACWLRISGIDGHAGPLFGRLAPSSQRLTRSSSACSESIAENLTISYPNIVGEFVDLYRVTPVEQMHCMLFHRPGPSNNSKNFS